MTSKAAIRSHVRTSFRLAESDAILPLGRRRAADMSSEAIWSGVFGIVRGSHARAGRGQDADLAQARRRVMVSAVTPPLPVTCGVGHRRDGVQLGSASCAVERVEGDGSWVIDVSCSAYGQTGRTSTPCAAA